ncbi:hypothetical protein ACTU6U_06130 [Microbacterium sp. A196]|uniref:hypothetical protein n=1 Tax=unclassified Microbacterium TaxID=2609290 RepID=UPI003FD28411
MTDLGGGIRLRPLEPGDGVALAASFIRNRVHLAPWDPLRDQAFFTGSEQERLVASLLTDRDAEG